MSERDALTEQVRKSIGDTYSMAIKYRYGDTTDEAVNGVDVFAKMLATDIIALVLADERTRIRNALLERFDPYACVSDAIEENIGNYDDVASAVAGGAWDSLTAALAAIGLTIEEPS